MIFSGSREVVEDRDLRIRYDNGRLTEWAGLNMILSAPIRAEPLQTLPQPESFERQRGVNSRISSSILCFTMVRCWGESRGASKGNDDASE